MKVAGDETGIKYIYVFFLSDGWYVLCILTVCLAFPEVIL